MSDETWVAQADVNHSKVLDQVLLHLQHRCKKGHCARRRGGNSKLCLYLSKFLLGCGKDLL